jgi:hypothetical protein
MDLAGHILRRTTLSAWLQHSEGHILWRTHRYIIWLTFPSFGYFLFWYFLVLTHSVFAISMSDVFAHPIILGSVQDLYAPYIYILSLSAPPTPFSSRNTQNNFCVFLFSLNVCTPMYCLFGGILVATSFLSENHRSSPLCATTCDKNGAIDL